MYHEDQIREALRRRPAALTGAAFALGCAVWQVEPGRRSHGECLATLPSFIEAEAGGQVHTAEFMRTSRHLHICPSCANMYFDLVRLTTADAHDGGPRLASVPPADLSFLDAQDD
jgi:hypothetical protein